MKKNITINLCGRLYQIDEDAYELLSHYTDTLRNYFKKQEGGEEIADDIEERIAELFDDLKAQGIEAITIEHVQGVIEQIGQVEEIAGENVESAENTEASSPVNAEAKKPLNGKKFFRDSQNKVLAGVLAGCAHYFGGSANGWRWGFVILSVLWIVFDGLCASILGVLALPIILLSVPFAFLPFSVYLLAAIFTPETKTPEDVLRMKGKEVNQQNLTMEVQESSLIKEKKNDLSFGDIFVGVLCIGLSTALTIGFIIVLCFFVAFVAAPDLMSSNWWDIDEQEVLEQITIPVILCGVMLLASISILLYCSIHAAASSFGKTPAMNTQKRLMWFVLWVLSLAGFIGCWADAANKYSQTSIKISEKRFKEKMAWNEAHTHDGFVFNDDDWAFFQNEGWKLERAENTDRYTYSGEYMTGDPSVRYLDACNWNTPVIFEARKEEYVEPGVYRLSAIVRASGTEGENATEGEKFIWVSGQDAVGDSDTNKDGLLSCLCKIPHCGNTGGNIWEMLAMEAGRYNSNHSYLKDPILKELVHRIPAEDRQKILNANSRNGYGWSYVYIDDIRVSKPTTIFYGIQVNDEETIPTTGWFSATDFKLERIGNLKK